MDGVLPSGLATGPAVKSRVYSATPLLTAEVRDLASGIDEKSIILTIDGEQVENEVRYFIPGTSGKSWDWYSYAKALVSDGPLKVPSRLVTVVRAAKRDPSISVVPDPSGDIGYGADGCIGKEILSIIYRAIRSYALRPAAI